MMPDQTTSPTASDWRHKEALQMDKETIIQKRH